MIDVQIDNLAIGGRGVGRLDGKAVFVPYTLPGENVRCRVIREKKNYCEAELLEVVDRSPDRVEPECPVFGECGGCQWQHMPYAGQLDWKTRLFRETIGKVHASAADLPGAIVPSPESWNYRCRAQIKCRLTENGFMAGFYRPGSHYVVDIESCPILAPRLNQLFAAVKPLFASYPLANRVPQLDISVDRDGRLQLIVHFLDRDHSSLQSLLAPLAADLEMSVYVQKGRKESMVRLFAGRQQHIEPCPGMRLQFPPGGFIQVNLMQNNNLVRDVLDSVPGQARVIDLYCGIGNFSLPVAEKAVYVAGVEDYGPAIDAAITNADRVGTGNTAFVVDDAVAGLERLWRDGCDVAILDPPRSGAFSAVKRLAELQPGRIIYVSCDPMTLARDLNVLLHGAYELVELRPYDMFPQTGHIEAMVVMDRSSR